MRVPYNWEQAIQRLRAQSLLIQFHFSLAYLDGRICFNRVQNFVQHLIEVSFIISDAGDPDSRLSPFVQIIHLSDGNIELLARRFNETFDDLTLIFQRFRCVEIERDCKGSYMH